MKKALIQGERICEIRDDTFPVHPDLIWVDVADGTTEFDTYVDGEVVAYVAPELTMDDLRIRRNTMLTSSDWSQGNDSPLSDGAKTEWATYRQELRDLPSTSTDPNAVVWPDEPEKE
jgi:hypothetical protein